MNTFLTVLGVLAALWLLVYVAEKPGATVNILGGITGYGGGNYSGMPGFVPFGYWKNQSSNQGAV